MSCSLRSALKLRLDTLGFLDSDDVEVYEITNRHVALSVLKCLYSKCFLTEENLNSKYCEPTTYEIGELN